MRDLRGPRESLLEEVPAPGDGTASGAAARLRPGRRGIAVLGLLLVLGATGLAAQRIGASALAASTGPLSWSAPVLVDHQYPYAFGSQSFNSLSCTSSALCVGDTGAGGDIVSSTDPSGASASDWSVLSTTLLTQSASGYSLNGASCVTESSGPFCVDGGFDPVDADGAILATTNPTGGAAAFTPEAFATGQLNGPACVPNAGSALCVAAAFPTGETSESLYASASPTEVPWTAIPVSGTSNTTDPNVDIEGIACPNAKGCMAALSNGDWLGAADPTSATSWTAPASTGLTSIQSLTCASASFCLAYGRNTNGALAVATTTSEPAARWTLPTTTGLSGVVSPRIACFADAGVTDGSLCIAGTAGPNSNGDPGGLLVSVDRGVTWTAETLSGYTDLPSAFSCPSSGAQCFIGTESGAVITGTDIDGSAGAPSFSAPVGAVPGDSALSLLDCPSSTLCVGADGAGNLLTESNGSPGAAASWSGANIDSPPNILLSLACAPSTTLCVAGDDMGNLLTTTNAAGGASSWSKPNSIDTGNALAGVACPSSSLCVAVDESGNALTSTTPATASSWKSAPTGDTSGLSRVTCAPATTLCVAIDEDGGLITSPDPATSPWSAPTAADPGNYLEHVSCPSATLCVAGDDEGNIITSTNPTGGASAWSLTPKVDTNGLDDVACPSSSLCVAEDFLGKVLVSTNPTGGASAWSTPTTVDPESPLESLACAPGGAQCVGGDDLGDVVAATPIAVTPPAVTTAAVSSSAAAASTAATSTTTPSTTTSTTTSTSSTSSSPPLPPPVLGKAVNVTPVSGTVLIKLPPGASLARASSDRDPIASAGLSKGTGFIPLKQARQIPVGSILDTTRGVVGITAASSKKNVQFTGDFTAGVFKLLQNRKQKGLTELNLMDTQPRNKVCVSAGKKASAAVSKGVLGLLRSKVHGSFTTRGDYSAATARGTQWSITDECAGTLTRVTRDVVSVQVFATRKTILVRAGHSFLARAPIGKR